MSSIEELMKAAIPRDLLDRAIFRSIPPQPSPPWEVEKRIRERLERGPRVNLDRIFAGGPACPHYVHPVTLYILSRGEFLTAYTPYQPEINQGALQALYEYQSLVAELLGVDVVNAGMYDGASSLAEASLMAVRVKGSKAVLIPSNLYPSYRRVLATYLRGPEVTLVEYSIDERGAPDLGDLEDKGRKIKPSAVILELPTSEGVLHDRLREGIELAHSLGSLAISIVEPTLMALVKPPGELGSDVVVAEGQPLGLPMHGGGNRLGILGIKMDRALLRQLPGRLVGATLDVDGRRSYALILQTREQHIRREKATSNITTNTALNAIAAAVHLSLLGGRGLRYIASLIYERSRLGLEHLRRGGVALKYPNSRHYKNIVYALPPSSDARAIYARVLKEGFVPFSLFSRTERLAQSCFTEVHSPDTIEQFARTLSRAIGEEQ